MSDDVEFFVRSCLHCFCTETGKIIPRPLGHALHAVEPNKLLHFDFCYISTGEKGKTYVLVLKDDHSSYVWLVPTTEVTAEAAATALIDWFATFGIVQQWVSDRGSHFKNEVVRSLKEKNNSGHHFTLAYCLWSNETVEVVCRELLRACRAMLSEYQLPFTSWPSIIPVVQSALNISILERLGNRCPLTVFTGLPQDNPLFSNTRKVGETLEVHSLEEIRLTQRQNIRATITAPENMHKDVATRTDKRRKAAVESHNRKTNVRPINFEEGDFVLRGLIQHKRTRKLSLKWVGPFWILECRSDYILLFENLLNGKSKMFMEDG